MSVDQRLQAFNDAREALLDEMEALPSAALTAKPSPDRWSLLEIIEHLVLAERVVFKGLPAPARLTARERRFAHRLRYLFVMWIVQAGVPVRMPSAAMAPRGDRGLAELRRMWDENQNWLRSCIDALGSRGLRSAVLEHPVAGPLTVEQAVVLGQIHFDGHVRQMRTLQRLRA